MFLSDAHAHETGGLQHLQDLQHRRNPHESSVITGADICRCDCGDTCKACKYMGATGQGDDAAAELLTAGWRFDGERWVDLDGVAMTHDEAMERHRRDVRRGNVVACHAVTIRDAVGPQNATGGGRR